MGVGLGSCLRYTLDLIVLRGGSLGKLRIVCRVLCPSLVVVSLATVEQQLGRIEHCGILGRGFASSFLNELRSAHLLGNILGLPKPYPK